MITYSKKELRFRRQWYIGKQAPTAEFTNNAYPLNDTHTLYAHKDVLIDQAKNPDINVTVLGRAFFPESPDQKVSARILQSVDNSKSFRSDLIELAGSYAILIANEKEVTIYNDAGGMMGVFYSVGESEAASTPAFLAKKARDRDAQLGFQFGPGNDWYTGSNTPFTNIKKLIPNCSLSLLAGTSQRFWPNGGDFAKHEKLTEGELIDNIAQLIRSLVIGVAMKGDALFSITGGQDSRVILAAARSHWDQYNYFTLSGKGIDKSDLAIVNQLVEKTGIRHRFYEIKTTPSWLFDMYDEISCGEAIGMRRQISGTCIDIAPGDAVHVNGNLGAICKSYYWHSKAPKTFQISSVIRDFISPGELTRMGVEEWLKTVPDLESPTLYNLFYLEQRGGRWMSAGENCSRLFYETFTPFNHRKFFTLVSSLPPEIQYGGKLLRILAREMAPELSDIPYAKARRNWTKYIPEKVKKSIRKFVS